MSFLPIIVLFVILYFIMIRPQMKRAKEQKAMIEALQKGDEVVTAGGAAGRISKLRGPNLTPQIAPPTKSLVGEACAAAQGSPQNAAVIRFPTGKSALIAFVIAAAFLYTLPNFFGESPAV